MEGKRMHMQYRWRAALLIISIFIVLTGARSALAACSDPVGDAGEMLYNADHEIAQYCDGTNWVAMGRKYHSGPAESALPSTGLIGHWKFNEGSGTTATDSAGSNNGTLTAMEANDWSSSGVLAGSLRFSGPGSGDYVTMGDINAFDTLGAMTLSMWVWAETWDYGTNWVELARKRVAGGDGPFAMRVFPSTSGNPRYVVFNLIGPGQAGYAAVADAILNARQWYHLAGTWDGNTVKLFVNGVQQTSTASYSGALLASAEPFAVGVGRPASDEFFNGFIDDVRVYDRALDPGEITLLASSVAQPNIQGGLKAHWKMDESSGTTVSNSSSVNNTGTILVKTNVLADAESTADWSTSSGTLATNADRQQGSFSLKLTATGNDAQMIHNKLTAWDLSNKTTLTFYAKSGTGSAINDGQLFLFTDAVGNTDFYHWNFTYPATWGLITIDLDAPTGTVGNPSLATIRRFRFDVNTSGNSGLIDYVTVPGDGLPATFLGGQKNNALHFTGGDDCVNIPTNNSSLQFTGYGSVSAWVKYSEGSKGGSIFMKQSDDYYGGGHEWGMILSSWSNGTASFGVVHTNGGDHSHNVSATSTLANGNWHHVAGVWGDGGDTLKIYVDGKLGNTATIDAGTLRTGTLPSSIGCDNPNHPTAFSYFSGGIDEVRVYDRALTGTDVLTLFCYEAPGRIQYSSNDHVMQFCSTSGLHAMGPVPGAGGAGCANPSGSEGELIYNADHNAMQYCDGVGWVAIGK